MAICEGCGLGRSRSVGHQAGVGENDVAMIMTMIMMMPQSLKDDDEAEAYLQRAYGDAYTCKIAIAYEGLTVEIQGDVRSEWIQVSLPNGLFGWIPLEAVGLV